MGRIPSVIVIIQKAVVQNHANYNIPGQKITPLFLPAFHRNPHATGVNLEVYAIFVLNRGLIVNLSNTRQQSDDITLNISLSR
jgi:hypothetical protein